MFSQICKVAYSHHIPGFFDPALRQLVQQCLSIDYRRRPSPKDCLGLLAQSDVGKPVVKRCALLMQLKALK